MRSFRLERQGSLTAHSGNIARTLLAWAPKNRDGLPWRRTPDPYRILVSEVMLQQTQVATVIPYYRRFLRAFPTLRSLAKAPLEKVLKAWEGLGYYARARNLHRLAQEVLRDNGGRFPTTHEGWKKLPGIGDYTAGAMASFAFGQDVPSLDSNTIRVLARLFGMRTDPSKGSVKKELRGLAQGLIPLGGGHRINLALMDLGATVCLPKGPLCGGCPVSRYCVARAKGIQNKLPVRRVRKPIPSVEAVIGIIGKAGRVLIAKRPAKGLLGGLWEFPGGKPEPGETLPQALKREVCEETGVKIRVREFLMLVKHAYSHFRVRLHVFSCDYLDGKPKPLEYDELKWVPLSRIRDFPFPKANQAIISKLCEAKY